MPTYTYSHTQTPKRRLWVTYPIVGVVFLIAIMQLYALGLPSYILFFVAAVFLFLLFITRHRKTTLTIEVNDTEVKWHFLNRMGSPVATALALSEIVSAEIVHFTPANYWGGGMVPKEVSYSPKYNGPIYALVIFSQPYLRMIRRDNSSVLLGTDDPQGLLQAVQSRLHSRAVEPNAAAAPISPGYSAPTSGNTARSDLIIMFALLGVGFLVILGILFWGLSAP